MIGSPLGWTVSMCTVRGPGCPGIFSSLVKCAPDCCYASVPRALSPGARFPEGTRGCG